MRPPSLKAADFQRALGSRPVARTAHFVLHVLPLSTQAEHVAAGAGVVLAEAAGAQVSAELSTSDKQRDILPVDELVDATPVGVPGGRLGLVLPKKQARRSVTRSLIRHQAREALRRHAPMVAADGRYAVAGWVLRLRAPFDRQCFPSAASDALKLAVRQELDELWSHLVSPASKGGRNAAGSKANRRETSRGAA